MFDIDFSKKSETMKFFEQKWYTYRPDKSCGGCNDTKDEITTVDLVTIEVLEAVKDASEKVKDAVVAVLCETRGKISPFMTKTIHAAHWGSWGDPTLSVVNDVLRLVNTTTTTTTTYVPGFETNYTSFEMVKRFAGGKRDEVRTMGAKSMRYSKYRGSKYVRMCLEPSIPGDEALKIEASCPPQSSDWDDLPFDEGEARANDAGWFLAYATRDAAKVHGASPTFVKPLELNRGHFGRGLFYASKSRFHKFAKTVFFSESRSYRGPKSIHIFIDSIYRQLKFSRTKKDGHIIRRGLPLERYELDRGHQLAASRDFDQLTTPYGVLNLTRSSGVPIVATQPHFFDSDPTLASTVIGLTPSRADHNTYIDVEPRSGEVLAAVERLQFNALLFDYDLPSSLVYCLISEGTDDRWKLFPPRIFGNETTNPNGFIMPIGYIDQQFHASHADVNELQDDLRAIDFLSDAAFIVFFVIAIIAFAASLRVGLATTTTTAGNNKRYGGDAVLQDDQSVTSSPRIEWSFFGVSRQRRPVSELPQTNDPHQPLISI